MSSVFVSQYQSTKVTIENQTHPVEWSFFGTRHEMVWVQKGAKFPIKILFHCHSPYALLLSQRSVRVRHGLQDYAYVSLGVKDSWLHSMISK